jgi:hypothetical protein
LNRGRRGAQATARARTCGEKEAGRAGATPVGEELERRSTRLGSAQDKEEAKLGPGCREGDEQRAPRPWGEKQRLGRGEAPRRRRTAGLASYCGGGRVLAAAAGGWRLGRERGRRRGRGREGGGSGSLLVCESETREGRDPIAKRTGGAGGWKEKCQWAPLGARVPAGLGQVGWKVAGWAWRRPAGWEASLPVFF